MATGGGGGGGGQACIMSYWKKCIRTWYPQYLQRRHFLPSAFMNRTQYTQQHFAGHTVHVSEPPVSTLPRLPKGAAKPLLQSDTRDDTAQVKVLRCLQETPGLEREAMFVISQMDFGDFLGKPAYAAAAKSLPRPVDPHLKAQNKHRGDFDLLILHRLYGIVVGEIKAIGDQTSTMSQQQLQQKIADKVRQAIKQLAKADDVISHIVSDQPAPPRIQKTLMLPNVSTAQLHNVLANDATLHAELCQCVRISTTDDPTGHCLTSDTLTNPDQWWRCVTQSVTDPNMTDDIYLDLLSRFCGPATTVRVACTTLPRLHAPSDVRTEGEGAVETAWRFTQFVLHPSQVTLLNSTDSLVFLTGPPGCGKTLVLVLKALDWLSKGKHVQVVSTWEGSMAASHLILSQVQHTAGPAVSGRVKLHTFDGYGGTADVLKVRVQAAVTSLMAASHTGELFVIADEIKGEFSTLCQELHSRLATGLHVWAAGIFHDHRPPLLTEVVLNEPLRTPPSVTREVQQSDFITRHKEVHAYSVSPSPLPSDGPAIRVIVHSVQDHGVKEPRDCEQCGGGIATMLHSLRIAATGIATPSSPPLCFSDVFLVANFYFTDTEVSPSGEVTQHASGMVRGLRQAGVPVTVVPWRDGRAVADVATRAGSDHVVATISENVSGLERPVVVYVDNGVSGDLGRLQIMSRCTGVLIWVKYQP